MQLLVVCLHSVIYRCGRKDSQWSSIELSYLNSYVYLYLHTVVQKSTCRVILIHVIQSNNLKDKTKNRQGIESEVEVSGGLVATC
jgi:hypothetical protein